MNKSKYRPYLNIIVLVLILLSGCATNKCKHFFSYRASKLDVKAIQFKLRKNGGEFININVGSALIDPRYTEVSDELKKLDLIQLQLCDQIRAIHDDSLKNVRRLAYIQVLTDMMNITSNPDSLLAARVSKLESAEVKRVAEEKYLYGLKRIAPKIDATLFLDDKSKFCYVIDFLNVVPIKFREHLMRDDGKLMSGHSIQLEDEELHYQKGVRPSFEIERNLNDPQLPTTDTFRLRLIISYYSIYAIENSDPKLYQRLEKTYLVDRSKKSVVEIKK